MIHICSFGSDIEDLKGKNRTEGNVLEILRQKPAISTFTFSEHYKWLQPLVNLLIKQGKIVEVPSEYPWHRYKVIAKHGDSHDR